MQLQAGIYKKSGADSLTMIRRSFEAYRRQIWDGDLLELMEGNLYSYGCPTLCIRITAAWVQRDSSKKSLRTIMNVQTVISVDRLPVN